MKERNDPFYDFVSVTYQGFEATWVEKKFKFKMAIISRSALCWPLHCLKAIKPSRRISPDIVYKNNSPSEKLAEVYSVQTES